MIQLARSGVLVDRKDVERMRLEFGERHFVLLPQLIEPALLNFLLPRLEQASWRQRTHEGIGVEVVPDDISSINLLHFLANTPDFLEVVQEIVGSPALTWFGGRVYRFAPNSGHYDSWHGDNVEGRNAGMSINLSERGYEGGVFEMRERSSKRMLLRFANTGLGNATLFRISKQLEHQVTEVRGDLTKTAFAGWFESSQPTLRSRLLSSITSGR
jgi:hypothetical protein